MPKILVLLHSQAGDITPLADAVADGARAVRFAEVDVRRVEDGAAADAAVARVRVLGSADELAVYDAIIVGATRDGALPAAVAQLFDQARASLGPKALVNRVGAAFAPGGTAWPALEALGDAGMILVTPTPAGDDADAELVAARALGHRVGHVAGWVTHAKSHHHH